MDIPQYLLEEKGIPLSDQQRQAVEAEGGEILLLAVPGAGKTTVLTARIAHLMANRRAAPRRLSIKSLFHGGKMAVKMLLHGCFTGISAWIRLRPFYFPWERGGPNQSSCFPRYTSAMVAAASREPASEACCPSAA